jgi:hypothetical protein
MRNAIRTTGEVCFLVCVLIAPALAQSWLQSGPVPAATGPDYNVSVGYTSLAMAIPAAGHVNLNGLDVSGRVDFGPRWGATVDSSYLRAANVFGTPRDGSVLSVHTGPVFYPLEHGNTRMFVHVLAGVSRVAGAVPMNETHYFRGWVVRFSYAGGGGIERQLSGPFAVRVGGDYLRTSFFDSTARVRPHDSLRLTVSVVFRLRGRQL